MRTTLIIVATLITLSTGIYAQNDNRILNKFDKDQDGKISKDEAPYRMKQNFHKHDLNKDGFISGDELNTLPKHRKQRSQNGQNRPQSQG